MFISHRRLFASLVMLAISMSSVGCTPRVIVRANPTSHDTGIRYYRPKPYLKVEPAEVAISSSKTQIVPSLVQISLVYLPDFAEEYSIDVRSGFGTADVGIKLEDGWNLTEISQDLDSQTDENLEAIGSLIGEIGGIVPTSQRATGDERLKVTVEASGVPIGFYESVIGRDGCGRKRLYGFRYLGFVPYSSCPIDMTGHQNNVCGDDCAPLYGLAFEAGRMVFKPLAVMASEPLTPSETVDATAADSSDELGDQTLPLPPAKSDVTDARLELELAAHLSEIYREITAVVIDREPSPPRIRIEANGDLPRQPVQRMVTQWWRERLGNVPADLEMTIDMLRP